MLEPWAQLQLLRLGHQEPQLCQGEPSLQDQGSEPRQVLHFLTATIFLPQSPTLHGCRVRPSSSLIHWLSHSPTHSFTHPHSDRLAEAIAMLHE